MIILIEIAAGISRAVVKIEELSVYLKVFAFGHQLFYSVIFLFRTDICFAVFLPFGNLDPGIGGVDKKNLFSGSFIPFVRKRLSDALNSCTCSVRCTESARNRVAVACLSVSVVAYIICRSGAYFFGKRCISAATVRIALPDGHNYIYLSLDYFVDY